MTPTLRSMAAIQGPSAHIAHPCTRLHLALQTSRLSRLLLPSLRQVPCKWCSSAISSPPQPPPGSRRAHFSLSLAIPLPVGPLPATPPRQSASGRSPRRSSKAPPLAGTGCTTSRSAKAPLGAPPSPNPPAACTRHTDGLSDSLHAPIFMWNSDCLRLKARGGPALAIGSRESSSGEKK